MRKFLALAPLILGLITVACGGAESPKAAATAAPIGVASPTATPAATSTTAPVPAATAIPTTAPVPTVTAVPTTAPVPTAPAATGANATTPTIMAQPTVTPEPASESTTPPFTLDLDMKNFRHPDATVQAGTTVVWTNLDKVQHTVTSGSPTDPDPGSLFDSGANQADWVTEGETYSFTFNQPGVFAYYCRIHGAPMSGTITVTPAAASSELTADANIQNFTHQNLTVQIGTTVVWTNLDGAGHTTTARQGQWDSGRLQKGQNFSFTFTEAGVFSYFCSIHRSMTGEVTVVN